MDPALAQAISTLAGALAVLILAIASKIRGNGKNDRDDYDEYNDDEEDPPPKRRRRR